MQAVPAEIFAVYKISSEPDTAHVYLYADILSEYLFFVSYAKRAANEYACCP